MTQTVPGVEGNANENLNNTIDFKMKNDLANLADDRAGGIDKIEFYPKNSNPFTGTLGYMSCSKNAYKFDKRQFENASTNFQALTRGSPCFNSEY